MIGLILNSYQEDSEEYQVCSICECPTSVYEMQKSAVGLICFICLSQNQHLGGEY